MGQFHQSPTPKTCLLKPVLCHHWENSHFPRFGKKRAAAFSYFLRSVFEQQLGFRVAIWRPSGNLVQLALKWQSGAQAAIQRSSGNLVLKQQSGAQVAIWCSSGYLVSKFHVSRGVLSACENMGFGCLGQRTSCNTCNQENAVKHKVLKTCGAPDMRATDWSGFRPPPLARCPPFPTPGSGGCA